MLNKYKFLSLILILLVSTIPHNITANTTDDFRTISFDNRGYSIHYEVIQGENLNEMFTNLGFDVNGLFTGSQFNILLRNRITQNREIYYIESDTFETVEVPVYSYESFIKLGEPLVASIETDGEFLTDLIGFNYYPVEQKSLEAELPEDSVIYLPKIFTNISRPNFGGLIKNMNYFDFLPFIIGNNFNRYEAEFASLILNESFTVNIYNQDSEEFTVSLDLDLESQIKMKATWDKQSGLLLSLSLHFVYENKSSVFIISLSNYEEIQSPITQPSKYFFISNSSANYEVFYEDVGTEQRLAEWKVWFDQLNQTMGLKYLYTTEGLDFESAMFIYDQSTESYSQITPIHDSWIAFLPSAVIPIWEGYKGVIKLINSIWNQLEDDINGYAFFLSGITSTLYTLQYANLHLEYQFNNGLHQLLWYGAIDYLSNNTRKVTPSYAVTNINFETEGWLAYSQTGMLEGFSFYFSETYNSYLQDYDDLSIIEVFDNYYYDYFLESITGNMTAPHFTAIKETSANLSILQIVFYSIVTYLYLRKSKKKRRKIEYQ